MNIISTICFLFLVSITTSSSQIIETKLPDGRVILVRPNGTWTSADSTPDLFEICHKYLEYAETNTFIIATRDHFISQSYNGNSEIKIYIVKNQNGSALGFTVKGASPCISIGMDIILYFTDGSQTIIPNEKEANCDGGALYAFPSDDPLNQVLKSRTISKIQVFTSSGFVEETLSPENRDLLDIIIKCIFQ